MLVPSQAKRFGGLLSPLKVGTLPVRSLWQERQCLVIPAAAGRPAGLLARPALLHGRGQAAARASPTPPRG